MKIESFQEVELIDGGLKAVFEYLGEGLSGDYQEDDSDDEPLLRFSCYESVGGEFQAIDDASYCTRMRLDTPPQILERALVVILKELKDARDGGSSGKKAMEAMSWLCIEDFEKEQTA